jgi:hypothetical protein
MSDLDLVNGIRAKIEANNLADLIDYSAFVIGKFTLEERNYFFKYMGLPFEENEDKNVEKFELPDSTKEKISKIVAKALENELK